MEPLFILVFVVLLVVSVCTWIIESGQQTPAKIRPTPPSSTANLNNETITAWRITDRAFRCCVLDIVQQDDRLIMICEVLKGQIRIGEKLFLERTPSIFVSLLEILVSGRHRLKAQAGELVAFRLNHSISARDFERGDHFVSRIPELKVADAKCEQG